MSRRLRYTLCSFLLSLGLVAAAPAQGVPPTFSKSFTPSTIGSGSISTLTFTITNVEAVPVTDLAFVDVLPAGVTIAAPSQASTSCTDGTVDAPDGGSTIDFSGGQLPAGASCTVTVDVTSATVGTHMNVSGDLTSSLGNSGTATADLTVATDRPGFTKSFSPSPVPLGQRSTLTFTIDNTANASAATNLAFTDNLPAGMEVADPANGSVTCSGGVLTAVPGTTTVSYSPAFFTDGSVAAGASCTVAVDVVATGAGELGNTSGELTSFDFGIASSGKAGAVLEVTVDPLTLVKSFTDDPVPPGGTATLEFTITNFDRNLSATAVTFTDDLDAVLSGLVAVGLPMNDVCGSGSQLSGTGFLTLTGGNLAPGASCTFSVPVQLPAGAAAGAYLNTTSSITGDVGGSMVTGGPGAELLFVEPAPALTKSFVDDPVGAGGSVTLEFTITNTSPTFTATDVAFEDEFFVGLPTASSVPAAGFCGPGSTATFFPLGAFPPRLEVTGAELAPGASCTFSITLDVAVGVSNGTYPNTTTPVTATVDGATVTGEPATDDLEVVAAPALFKSFTDDPVQPGDTVTLEFTLLHSEFAPADATAITFTDDLGATLTGLAAVGLPMNDVCGSGSQISGTTNLSFTGGTLAPGESCTFSVTLQVPMGAAPGFHTNTTSTVVATVSGETAMASAAVDDLLVAGLTLTKSFVNDPVLPGATVDLEFTIDNVSATADATNIFFSDDLDIDLAGLAATGLPMIDVCGAGSSLVGSSGNTFLTFSGGNLLAGESCTFTVTLQVPPGTASGSYGNVTTGFSATLGGTSAALANAMDTLVVDDQLLFLTKEFTDDPVSPGDPVTLEFTVTNLDAALAITGVTFTDDLDAALSGLAAVGLPMNDVCGAGSQISGTSLLTLTGGSLPAGGSCTFSVTVMVPASVPLGTVVTNTTSEVTGTAGGLGVAGAPASDQLRIDFLTLAKSFDGPTVAGGSPILSITITNLDATSGVSGLSLSDDLDAVLSGLVAVGLPVSDVCGAGSQLSGTSFLTLTGASLLPGGSCTLDVPLQLPAGAAPGSYLNTTSELFQVGSPVATPATATLEVEPPPTFFKAFAPNSIGIGQVSTLTFTIDNSASAVATSALDFTDVLPAGVVIATPGNASTTCLGGTLTATDGSGMVAYTGGTVAAGVSCTVTVDVTATAAGALVNTSGDLTSSSGNSGPATDTLTANPQPGFAKAFAPNPIVVGGVSTLTFTVDNTASTVAATGLDFTDGLPAGLVVATPPNASTTCTGGTLTAVSDTALVSYTGGTVAAGASCTVSVDVRADVAGALVNTSGALTSSLGTSGTATDTLTVNPPPGFSKLFAPNPIVAGGVSTLTFTIDNTASTVAATGLDFTDPLPAPVTVATPANASTTCTGGTLTATSGTGTVAYTGGSVAAGASCTVTVDVTSTTFGAHVNVSGDLTSSLGNSGTATDTLNVDLAPPLFAKAFDPATIVTGGVSTLTLTVDNTLNTAPVGNLDVTDGLPAGVVVADPANAGTDCTGGTVTAAPGSGTVAYTGGTVAAGSVCTVTADVTAAAPGVYTNVTGELTSDAGSSGTATADLTVVEALTLAKSFAHPVLPGGVVELEFTVTNPSAFPATAITFTDDLDAVIPGLAAVGLPAADVCGAGSQLAGTSLLTLTGGTLPAGGSCTFSATLELPATAPFGVHLNTTSPVGGTVQGSPVSGAPAAAEVEVVFLGFEKSFAPGPVVGGTTTTLTFVLANPDPVNEAAGITFTDDLEAVLTGLVAIDTPRSDVCGAGSEVSGSSLLILTGGVLPPGGSCTFDVEIEVPGTAPAGEVTNVTSVLEADVGGSMVAGDPADVAVAVLTVVANVIEIPTLSGWGILLLAAGLGLLGWRRIRGS